MRTVLKCVAWGDHTANTEELQFPRAAGVLGACEVEGAHLAGVSLREGVGEEGAAVVLGAAGGVLR